MNHSDFNTALARLLRDATLRQAFAQNPQAVAATLNLLPADAAALAALDAPSLEVQAEILLRKRFAAAQRLVPWTLERLADSAWAQFHHYASAHWPEPHAAMDLQDAVRFLEFLAAHQPNAVCPPELNRLRFVLGPSRLACHWVSNFPRGQRRHSGLQLLWKSGRGWTERFIYLSL